MTDEIEEPGGQLSWSDEAPPIRIGGLTVVRCQVQPRSGARGDAISFEVAPLVIDEIPLTLMMAECSVTAGQWTCKGTVTAHLEARDSAILDRPMDELGQVYGNWAAHALWDTFGHQARILFATVGADVEVPSRTPVPRIMTLAKRDS